MKNFSLFLAIPILAFSGCTFYAVDAHEVTASAAEKESHREVQYLETVTVPYETIGQVTVNTERRNSMEEVIEKMKRQVAVLGGDAVTNIVQTDKPSSITHIRTDYTGTVIVFKGAAPEPNSAWTPSGEPIENFK